MSNPPSGADRRAHPRLEAAITAHFIGPNDKSAPAQTRDISRGGCALLAPRIRLVNERLALALENPATGERVEVHAEVRRAAPLPNGTYLLGVQFVDMTDALAARIAHLVESVARPATPGAPKALAALPPEVAKIVDEAFQVEMTGKLAEAARILDKALPLAPDRADLFATRARLASQTNDVRGASSFARRAAELEPSNAQYATLYQRFAGASAPGTPAPTEPAAPAPATRPARKAKSFLPADARGWTLTALAAFAFVLIIGGNVWHWVLRPSSAGPSPLDPAPYSALVPLERLAVGKDSRAFGTVVTSGWTALPDQEQRVGDLAARLLQEHGATSVVLSDGDARLVATVRDGKTRVFPR